MTTAQNYILWIHDRDAKPVDSPAFQATRFKNVLEKKGHTCYIWKKREIEYYYPEIVHVIAQEGNEEKIYQTKQILYGDQSVKYRKATNEYINCQYENNVLCECEISLLDPKTYNNLDPAIQNSYKKQKVLLDCTNGKIQVLQGADLDSYKDVIKSTGVCVPEGSNLKKLLEENVKSKDQLNIEIIRIVEGTLIRWRDEILGNNFQGNIEAKAFELSCKYPKMSQEDHYYISEDYFRNGKTNE